MKTVFMIKSEDILVLVMFVVYVILFVCRKKK